MSLAPCPFIKGSLLANTAKRKKLGSPSLLSDLLAKISQKESWKNYLF